ncbi:MAG: DUF4199 domain-containing protein [Bacteroidota bacterium]
MQVAAVYGVYYGLAVVVSMMTFYLLDIDVKSKVPSIINYLLMVLFIVIGVKSHRDQDLNGNISYGGALGTGTLIGAAGGFIVGGFSIILFSFIDPDMTNRILETSREQLLEQGQSEEQVEMALQMARKFMSPAWLFVFGIIGNALLGLFFSLFTSLFLKKDSGPFQSDNI